MNTEHTPGPWRVDYAQGIVAEDGTVVAYVEANHSDTPSPDARLIAAAPDLLEALKLSLIEHKEVRGFLNVRISELEPVHKWLEETQRVIGVIESAIAKAEGKS